jgi:hypothetical protein
VFVISAVSSAEMTTWCPPDTLNGVDTFGSAEEARVKQVTGRLIVSKENANVSNTHTFTKGIQCALFLSSGKC